MLHGQCSVHVNISGSNAVCCAYLLNACLVLQEDVLYALSQSDSLTDLGVSDPSTLTKDSRDKMLYLLNDEGGSTPTLSYLRSVYNTPGQPRTQWANFVERVRDLAVAQGIKGLPKVVEEVRCLLLIVVLDIRRTGSCSIGAALVHVRVYCVLCLYDQQ